MFGMPQALLRQEIYLFIAHMPNIPSFRQMPDEEVSAVLRTYGIHLTIKEARRIEESLRRPPTYEELVAWSIEGSEHCSYKSSKPYLKLLPTDAPNVILGPSEDAGVVSIAQVDGVRYGIAVAHESHNHPSQVVPYEGAATGIGGVVRDVICMGARVVGIADPLRFGDARADKTPWIYEGVTAGIGGYANPIGIPALAGDVYFSPSFNQNCLVNVVAIGVVKETSIIHSFVPQDASWQEYDIVIVGKPTDMSGMGGAAFASLTLDSSQKEQNKSAVQEPNAFLKRHLMVATQDLFFRLEKKGELPRVALKDLGAGGLFTAVVEMVARHGFGAELFLDALPVNIPDLPAAARLCAETQERFVWIVPSDLSSFILHHYNIRWDLPKVSKGARACTVGTVSSGSVRAYWKGEKVVDVPAREIVSGASCRRPVAPPVSPPSSRRVHPPSPPPLFDVWKAVLRHPDVSCREPIYSQYDKQVQGHVVIEAGEADAGVFLPLREVDVPEDVKRVGIAVSVDGNPRYGRKHPYWQGVNTVVEAMRNVAAVGAVPWALTDCLNYGNPEIPEDMWAFVEGVRGVAEAARYVHLKGYGDSPVPVISGNVSFYNEFYDAGGGIRGSIDPCAIVACIGRMDDAFRAVRFSFTKPKSRIVLVGERREEFGGSVYYEIQERVDGEVPQPDFETVRQEIYAVTDCIGEGWIRSCHDISDGGMAAALSEMCFGNLGEGRMGATVFFDEGWRVPLEAILFSETGGFLMEVSPDCFQEVAHVLDRRGVWWREIGVTGGSDIVVQYAGKDVVRISVEECALEWKHGLRSLLHIP